MTKFEVKNNKLETPATGSIPEKASGTIPLAGASSLFWLEPVLVGSFGWSVLVLSSVGYDWIGADLNQLEPILAKSHLLGPRVYLESSQRTVRRPSRP